MADQKDDLLGRYPKEIAFLRGQFQKTRLRLVLGAGVSMPIGFPSWGELVERIAIEIGEAQTIGGELEKSSLTAKVQYLQNLFVDQLQLKQEFFNECFSEEESLAKWHNVLRESLYRNAALPSSHPYLKSLISLMRDSRFIVTYNFDDSVEQLVGDIYPDEKRQGKKPFETTWSLAAPLKDGVLTIYHPNGFISSRRHEYPSDRIVFSDETFSDQIIGEQVGNHSLIYHFLQNTFLLLGLSLDDVSLRQHLRRMAIMAPGLNHVLVAYEKSSSPYSKEQKAAISKANFEVYNLLTMFLSADDVVALIELLGEDKAVFSDRAEKLGVPIKYTFYVTGGVGAGKTTSVNQFGSCFTYDEWVEESPDTISKPFNELTREEKNSSDRWIERQFALKNRALRGYAEGVHIIDRCPLDPLAFETANLEERATQIKNTIRPGLSNTRIEDGQILLLECPADELQRRLISKNKYRGVDTIQSNADRLRAIYAGKSRSISSYDSDINKMTKSLSRMIFFEEYRPSDVDGMLVERVG